MVKKQSTAKGFTVLGAASILNKMLSLIYVPFLTLMITSYGNGITNVGYTVYLLIYQVTYMGIPVALSKMIAEQAALRRYRDSVRTLRVAIALLFGMGAILGGALALFAAPVARLVGSPQSAMTLFALAPTVLIASFSAAFRGYFQGRHNMTPTSVSQIVEQAANTLFTLVFAWWFLKIGRGYAVMHGITDSKMISLYSFQWGAAGSGLGTTAGAVFSAVYLSLFYLKRRRHIREEAEQEDVSAQPDADAETAAPALASDLAKRLLKYAAPIVLGALVVYSAQLIDMGFTIMRLKHAGFSEVEATSLYGVLTTQYLKIIGVPLAVANTLAVVLLPGVSGAVAKKDTEALHAKIDSGFRTVFLITLPAAALLAVLAEPLIRLLFPREVLGMDLMQLGSWVIVLMAMVQLETSVLQGMGQMQLPVLNTAIGLVLKIAVNYVLIGISVINVRGAVAGSLMCYGFAAALNFRKIRMLSGYEARWGKLLLGPLAATAIMAGAAWGTWSALNTLLAHVIPFVYWRNLAATVAALAMAGTVYAVHIAAFRAISRGEIRSIPGLGRIVGKERLERLLEWMRV